MCKNPVGLRAKIKEEEEEVSSPACQRGLIHTGNNPLGRLCKMCNPFFHEFRVTPPAN